MYLKLSDFRHRGLPVAIRSSLVVFLLSVYIIHSSRAQAPETRVNIQLLGPEQGLPSRNIRSFSQDGRGFMWVGSTQELWRYDGYIFQDFTKILTGSIGSTPLINVIRTDADGKIWVVHNAGITIIDPVSFRCVTIDPSRSIENGAPKQNLDIFFDIRQNAWVALPEGRLVKLDKSHVPIAVYAPGIDSDHPPLTTPRKYFCDSLLNLYVYSKGNEVEVISQDAKLVRRLDLLDAGLSAAHYFVLEIAQSDPEGLIVYYRQKGRKKIQTRTYSFKEHTFSPLTDAENTTVPAFIYSDNQGYQWYRSNNEVGFLNRRTGKFTSLNAQLSQKAGSDPFFFEGFISSDNSFWLSGIDGLFKITLATEIFRKYLNIPLEKPGDIGTSIRGITEDPDGKIWVSSYGFNDKGQRYLLHRIDPQTGTLRHLRLHWTGNTSGYEALTYKLLFADDFIYAITDGNQFLKIDPATLAYRAVEFPFVSGRGFTSFYRLNEHKFWMGTWGNMAQIDTRDLKPITLNDRPGNFIKKERINHFLPWTNHRIMVSTTNGLYVLDQDAIVKEHYGQTQGDEIRLPGLQIFHTAWYRNALWAASAQGLMRIDTDKKEVRLFTTQDGLPDNNIYAALADDHGSLWMSTNRGLSRFDMREQKFYNYSTTDGLPHMEFNHGAYLKAGDGTLYFGGVNGLVAFQPALIDTTKQKDPEIQLIFYAKHHAELNRVDTITNHRPGSEIVFNPGDRLFAFSFMSPDYHNPALNRFRYKLEGWNDDHWQMFENGNKLLLNSLPSGNYILRVQVSVAGDDWSTHEWQTPVRVIGPFYKSPWFFLLCTLAIGVVIYLFYRYRLQQILYIQRIRNGISADMHDEIGGTLSSITFYSQALLMQLKQTEHQEVVQKIKENAQHVQDGLSDIVWSVKAGRDEINDVLARMLHFGSELAESRGIIFHFETDPQLKNLRLDMQTRKNFYLIFKEVVNNAAKHAECSTIHVDINPVANRVRMVIRDDGKGFDSLLATRGNGLTNMQQRAAQMKGQLTIQSAKGNGTVITLIFC